MHTQIGEEGEREREKKRKNKKRRKRKRKRKRGRDWKKTGKQELSLLLLLPCFICLVLLSSNQTRQFVHLL
jgi:hypothetical protein